MSKITILSTYHACMYIQIFQAKQHANGIIYLFFFLHMNKHLIKTPSVDKDGLYLMT